MPEKPITKTIQAKHVFSSTERLSLADQLTAAMQTEETIEAELASVKADYKSRLERVSLERNSAAQKLRDKFEMRATLAVVALDHPSPGRKSYFFATENETGIYESGEFIRDEPMEYEDKQRKLPLEEKPDSAEVATRNTAYESQETPPPGFDLVTEGVSQEGDLYWSDLSGKWMPVVNLQGAAGYDDCGAPVDAYHALARPIGTPAPSTPDPRPEATATTPLGQVLQNAAAGKELPLVNVKLSSEFTADKARAQFRKAAKKQGWGETEIDFLDDLCLRATDAEDAPGSIKRVLEILNAHTVETAE